MNLYPAIDLYQGKVVRLTRGDFSKQTVYSEHPEAVAQEWERQGARWLHVVDLEGAKTGSLKNVKEVIKIRKSVKCRIQFGGGLRTITQMELLVAKGIDRLVVGTKALDQKFLKSALGRFRDHLAVSLDVRGNIVQVAGWQVSSGKPLEKVLLESSHDLSLVKTLIYTDIQKDGMLEGPSLHRFQELLSKSPSRFILSGGISQLGDIRKLRRIRAANFEGVIIGKALYEKKFSLREALEVIASLPAGRQADSQ